MQFSAITGQASVKNKLVELVQHNRLSHALLFSGREGNGSLSLAIAFTQYLVCEKVKAGDITEDSCGECSSCTKAARLVHPDIHFSYPTVTTKPGEKPIATDFINDWREFIKLSPYGNLFDWIEQIKTKENSQGKITAEECNDIIHKLSLKSFESGYKILIMWMPEMLGTEGNKLLKLIEEPPQNTLFILVTENEPQMLQTIVSRCQMIKIPALHTKDIADTLIAKNNTEPTTAIQIASVSEGNYREALQLIQHSEEDWQAILREWLNSILKTGPVAQTKWVEEISRLGREKQKQFLLYFNHLLGQALLYRIMGDRHLISDTEKDFAERLNKIAGIEQQQAILKELDKAGYYIERNAHGKMLFHALTIKLYHIIQDGVVFE